MRRAKSLPALRTSLSCKARKFFFRGQPLLKNGASQFTFELLFASDGLGSLRVGLTVAFIRIRGNSRDPKNK
jgi:hypothetical protein